MPTSFSFHFKTLVQKYLQIFVQKVSLFSKDKAKQNPKINEQKITAYCITHFSCVVKFFDELAITSKCPSTFVYKKQFFVSYTIAIVYHAHVTPFDSFTGIRFNLLATCLFQVNVNSLETPRTHRCLKI